MLSVIFEGLERERHLSTLTLKSTHVTFIILVYQVPQKNKVNECVSSVCVSLLL